VLVEREAQALGPIWLRTTLGSLLVPPSCAFQPFVLVCSRVADWANADALPVPPGELRYALGVAGPGDALRP